MAATINHRPGQADYVDTALVLSDTAGAYPATVGAISYANALFALTDGQGSYEPRLVYTKTHSTIPDAIHFLEEGPAVSGAYKVTNYAGATPFISSIVWYTSSAQTKRIVDRTFTYPSGSYATITTDVLRVYAADGVTVAQTLTDQIVYQGLFETGRLRT